MGLYKLACSMTQNEGTESVSKHRTSKGRLMGSGKELRNQALNYQFLHKTADNTATKTSSRSDRSSPA
jgi:hypothetical protein